MSKGKRPTMDERIKLLELLKDLRILKESIEVAVVRLASINKKDFWNAGDLKLIKEIKKEKV